MSEVFNYPPEPTEEGDQQQYDDQSQQPKKTEFIGLDEVLANLENHPFIDHTLPPENRQGRAMMDVLAGHGVNVPEVDRRCNLLLEKFRSQDKTTVYKVRVPLETLASLPRYANVDPAKTQFIDVSTEGLIELYRMGEEQWDNLATVLGSLRELEAQGVVVRGDGVICQPS